MKTCLLAKGNNFVQSEQAREELTEISLWAGID
jgi:hypothetical protein